MLDINSPLVSLCCSMYDFTVLVFGVTMRVSAVILFLFLVLLALAAGGSVLADGALVFSDDFNRANGPAGSSWLVAAGTWNILSNELQCAGSGQNRLIYQDGGTADAYITAKIVTVSSDNRPGIVFRHFDVSNYWYVRPSSGVGSNWLVVLRSAGTETTIATGSIPVADGQVLAVRAQGSDIRVFVDGQMIAAFTNSTHATRTRHGLLCAFGGSAKFDDFALYDVGFLPTPTIYTSPTPGPSSTPTNTRTPTPTMGAVFPTDTAVPTMTIPEKQLVYQDTQVRMTFTLGSIVVVCLVFLLFFGRR